MEPQYWLIVGVIIGIVVDFFGRWLYNKVLGPKIRVPKEDKEVWWIVDQEADLAGFRETDGTWYFVESMVPPAMPHKLMYIDWPVIAYRLKVKNEGRRAAENVAGTIKFGTKGERRICWYEGNVATVTLNAEDHSFLDVYGVLIGKGKRICMPTENGWKRLNSFELKDKLKIKLRVTAKNAKPYTIRFEIDPARLDSPDYRPTFLSK